MTAPGSWAHTYRCPIWASQDDKPGAARPVNRLWENPGLSRQIAQSVPLGYDGVSMTRFRSPPNRNRALHRSRAFWLFLAIWCAAFYLVGLKEWELWALVLLVSYGAWCLGS